MKPLRTFLFASALTATLAAICPQSGHAAMIISEVDSGGSGASYAGDWFELTNTGASAVDITGWKVDDNSNLFSAAVSLRGITSIDAGQSVVFIEGGSTNANDTTLGNNFKAAWFGSNLPVNFTLGFYGGSGVGLSSTADAVNIFNAGGTLITRVDFGAGSSATFDNAAGLNNVTLTTASVVGVNGAFASATSNEIGSPGAVPEPGSIALLGLAGTTLLFRRRR